MARLKETLGMDPREALRALEIQLQDAILDCGDIEDWLNIVGDALDQLQELKAAAAVIARRQIILSIAADRPFAFCHDCGLYTFNPKENDPPHTEHCSTGTVLRIIEEGGEESA